MLSSSIQTTECGHFLKAVVDQARVFVGGDTAALCLLDPDSRTVHMVAGSGPAAGQVGRAAPAEQGLAGEVRSSATTVLRVSCPSGHCCPFLGSAAGPHCHLAVPFRAEQHQGVLCATVRGPRPAAGDPERLLARLGQLAASGIGREDLCDLARELGELGARLRLAAEVHDGLAQTLAYVQLQIDRTLGELSGGEDPRARLMRVRDTLERANADLRAIMQAMRGPVARCDLREAVCGAVTQVAGSGRAVRVRAEGTYPVLTPTADEVQWVVREAVGNALRHGQARRVDVLLCRDGPDIVVRVDDDGLGLRPDFGTGDRQARFGLGTMRQRAAGLGGQLAVRARGGRGTTVELRWPDPVS